MPQPFSLRRRHILCIHIRVHQCCNLILVPPAIPHDLPLLPLLRRLLLELFDLLPLRLFAPAFGVLRFFAAVDGVADTLEEGEFGVEGGGGVQGAAEGLLSAGAADV